MEWISVDDGLPECTTEVLVTDGTSFTVAWNGSGDIWHLDIDLIDIRGDSWCKLDEEITHWMPLPAPPEANE